ncbi:unnamed protein product [Arabidopsis halleri]
MGRHVSSEWLSLSEGCEVEIFYKNNGTEGVWYKAIIESKPLSEELGVRLLKDDSLTPLGELKDNDKVLIRPIPPKNMQAGIKIRVGTFVDADYKDAWWTGLVVRKFEDGKCLVCFDSPPDIIQFERKHLRPHLHWGDEKIYSWWAIGTRNYEFLRRLAEEPMFSPGTMVEVSSKINETEVVWVPAMVIKEFKADDNDDDDNDKDDEDDDDDDDDDDSKDDDDDDDKDDDDDDDDDKNDGDKDDDGDGGDDDEYKYIVRVCDKSLSCKSSKSEPNKIVDLRSLRPTPPSISIDEYQSEEYVEVFHGGMGWRQGRVMGTLSQKLYTVLLEATKKELVFKHSDLRPLKVWEDGIWKVYNVFFSLVSVNTRILLK